MNRFERLINHLEELEKQTGGKLRTEIRYIKCDCPMMNFAPDNDRRCRTYHGCDCIGLVVYRTIKTKKRHYYDIYNSKDSEWWENLSYSYRRKLTNKVIKWLKER